MKRLIHPDVQVGVALSVIGSSLVMVGLTLLRYTPLEAIALGRGEPLWVLILSELALLYAGFSALPAALAYREVKA